MLLISVIVPIYNVDKYLESCIRSIINQTYYNLEIILVDDGSTDNSGKIIDEYAQKDSRIKVIHQKNKGVSNARNNGLAIANGDYIIFLDSDDIFDLTMLEKLLNKATQCNTDITICREYSFTNDENSVNKILWTMDDKLIPQEEVFSIQNYKDKLLNFCILWPWDKLYKKSFLDSIAIKYCEDRKIQASEDLVFVGETIARASSICILNEYLIKHRYHSKSLESTRKIQTPYLALKKFKDILINNHLYDDLECTFLNLAIHILNWHTSTIKKNKFIIYFYMKFFWLKNLPILKYSIDYYFNQSDYLNFSRKYSKSIFFFLISKIFSIKNLSDRKHKIITILGIKLKFKRRKNV